MFSKLHDQVVDLGGSILGFADSREFVFKIVEEGNPYVLLQSMNDEHIGFLTADPFFFFKDYSFTLSEEEKERLGIRSSNEVLVLNVVTIKDPFLTSTINLLAPIVINAAERIGRQLVLPSSCEYGTSVPLFGHNVHAGKGNAAHADLD